MKSSASLQAFLERCELFTDLTEEEISSLLPYIHSQHFVKDDIILQQGDEDKKIYIVQKGVVEIYKTIEPDHTHFSLSILRKNQVFGEMAFLEKAERSASAKALQDTQLIIVDLPHDMPVSAKIMATLGKKVSHRLRKTGELAIKQEEKMLLDLLQMEQFLIYLFILISLFFYAFKITTLFSDLHVVIIMPSIFIVCLGVCAALLVKLSPYPKEFFGLTWKNARKHTHEAILFSLPIILVMTLLKWTLIREVPALGHVSLFAFKQDATILAATYVLLVPVQEFIARGCLQSMLQKFFHSKNKVWLAILTSNLLFGLFHGFKTFTFIVGAFLLGNFWGWLYARQKSIVGPCISHALIGGLCFSVLDYMSILVY